MEEKTEEEGPAATDDPKKKNHKTIRGLIQGEVYEGDEGPFPL